MTRMMRILLRLTIFALGAQGAAAQTQACDGVISQTCLLRLGAGALAPQDDCSAEMARYRACLADQVLREERSKTNAALDFLMSDEALETTTDFLESRVGPPKYSRGPFSFNTRTYEIDGCEAEVWFQEGSATSIALKLSESCAYGLCDIPYIKERVAAHCAAGRIRSFGDFAEAFRGASFQMMGCLSECGNAVVPEFGFRQAGARVNRFTNFEVGVAQNSDQEIDASFALRDRLRAMGYRGPLWEMGEVCGVETGPAIIESFAAVPLEFARLTRTADAGGCSARMPLP